ncbi:ATP-binding protein [Blastococcus sp. PRF04-17]|uniref:ATP-binding protein n=1 Tax=Blastococcus sp. PRF04-17 TaxID=2933797 RepID=UPI003530345D
MWRPGLRRLLEVAATGARWRAGGLRFATLRSPASLNDFDYDTAPGVDRVLIQELVTCRYLETATNVLLIGPRESARSTSPSAWRRPERRPATARTSPPPRPPPPTCPPLPPRRDRGALGLRHALLRRPRPVGHRWTGLPAAARRAASALLCVARCRWQLPFDGPGS